VWNRGGKRGRGKRERMVQLDKFETEGKKSKKIDRKWESYRGCKERYKERCGKKERKKRMEVKVIGKGERREKKI
jgi:hypothetical protein